MTTTTETKANGKTYGKPDPLAGIIDLGQAFSTEQDTLRKEAAVRAIAKCIGNIDGSATSFSQFASALLQAECGLGPTVTEMTVAEVLAAAGWMRIQKVADASDVPPKLTEATPVKSKAKPRGSAKALAKVADGNGAKILKSFTAATMSTRELQAKTKLSQRAVLRGLGDLVAARQVEKIGDKRSCRWARA